MKKVFSMMLIIASLLCLSSCSKDEDEMTISTDYVEIYVGDTYSLTCSKKGVTWTTDNKLIASVTDGLIKGVHVGETVIHVEDLTCRVKVKPKYNMFTEPILNKGVSISFVKSKMSAYSLKSEQSNALVYYGNGHVTLYAYLFENGNLDSSCFYVSAYDSIDLVYFLSERYVLVSTKKNGNEYEYGFMSLDNSYAVTCWISSSSQGQVIYSW